MKTKFIAMTVLTMATIGLSGCVINVGEGEYDKNSIHPKGWEYAQKQNRQHIEELTLGMSKERVLSLMGRPDINEAFLTTKNEGEEGQEVQVLFYRTQHNSGDGKTTKDECTPLVIKNGKLVGWGEKAYRYVH
ncbi:DUF3192 domain-containing protein [Parashewanella spongiae]|uniref:DUF3192 domain-containing protein n=1 Tax=Parashewanella spongiae TaxID=342950 RepID=A0A3A6UBX6_9GAMM|nr:DUF3192 domain-containing protein [Parashewanella spongiae]MCL1076756.1 DUF3192 domain-containing protein [Parashewanella spongiae]RJY19513.1 DUF3192 domain-containing protein [Parashewanella spongiae]